jgi:lipopolysaccharide export LptBFGC system permease protein LptF
MTEKKGKMIPFLLIGSLFVAVALFGWWVFRWQYNRADVLLDQWAHENNYTVIDKLDANPSGTGPKDRWAKNKQIMYRVTVKDSDGNTKSGVVKLGSEHSGTISDQVTVEWDK